MSKARKKFERLLLSSVSNLAMSFADSYIEKNVEVRASAGLKATVIRRQVGNCCKWCRNLTGIYTADQLPKDIYKRHANCRCMVTYKTEKAYTDVWNKKQFATEKEARIEREKEIKAEAAREAERNKAKRLERDRKLRESDSKENIERQRQRRLEKEKEILNSQGNNEIDFYTGPNGKTIEAKYKDWIGENKMTTLLEEADSELTKVYIRSDYRKKSFIGDGGTAAIREFEKATGLNCGRNGNNHAEKVKNLISQINKILLKSITEKDKIFLKDVLTKLKGLDDEL